MLAPSQISSIATDKPHQSLQNCFNNVYHCLPLILRLLNAVASLCASIDKKSGPYDPIQHGQYNGIKGKGIKKSQNTQPNSTLIGFDPKHLPAQFTNQSLLSVASVLGIDYAECIPFRSGSILYAFCNIKLNMDPVWISNNQNCFLNYLHLGVQYFQSMLSLRRSVQMDQLRRDAIKSLAAEAELNSQQSVLVEEAEVEALRKVLLHKQQILGEFKLKFILLLKLKHFNRRSGSRIGTVTRIIRTTAAT